MIILLIHIIVSYDQNISLIFLCERWIPCQAVTSVLSLHYRPETVHCSKKDAYTSEITFLALHPCIDLRNANIALVKKCERNWVFATTSDFLIPIFLQSNIVDLRYFKLNIKALHHQIIRLQRLNSFSPNHHHHSLSRMLTWI